MNNLNSEWRETTVEDFLGLSTEEMAYIELKVTLAKALKTRRQQRNLSQQALAQELSSSQSRVAKMEGADSSVSLDLMVRSLLYLEMSPQEIGSLFVG